MFKTAILALAIAATPAFAALPYQAQPAATPSQERFVLRDTVWKCGAAGCVGTKSGSRPAVVCAVLAREVGSLRSFAAEGRTMSAEELEKCNARAN